MLISYYANKKSSPRLPSWQPSLISFNTPIDSGSIIKPCTLKHFQVPIFNFLRRYLFATKTTIYLDLSSMTRKIICWFHSSSGTWTWTLYPGMTVFGEGIDTLLGLDVQGCHVNQWITERTTSRVGEITQQVCPLLLPSISPQTHVMTLIPFPWSMIDVSGSTKSRAFTWMTFKLLVCCTLKPFSFYRLDIGLDKPWTWTDIYPAYDVYNPCKQGTIVACFQPTLVLLSIHGCHEGKFKHNNGNLT